MWDYRDSEGEGDKLRNGKGSFYDGISLYVTLLTNPFGNKIQWNALICEWWTTTMKTILIPCACTCLKILFRVRLLIRLKYTTNDHKFQFQFRTSNYEQPISSRLCIRICIDDIMFGKTEFNGWIVFWLFNGCKSFNQIPIEQQTFICFANLQSWYTVQRVSDSNSYLIWETEMK